MSLERQTILGMEVDCISAELAMDRIYEWVATRGANYVCVSNVHQCMETFDDPEFRTIINSADMVVPDSQVLEFALRFLGFKKAGPVMRGVDLMLALCARAEAENVPIALYGGTEESLRLLQSRLLERYPGLGINSAISPPFRPLSDEEMEADAETIRMSGARLLFVGIGCPKQERWMYQQRDRLPVVMLGVGAAFDFVAGVTRPSPAWVHPLGLEWLYRLVLEPRRLWKRYIKHNPRFVFHLLMQKLGAQYPPL